MERYWSATGSYTGANSTSIIHLNHISSRSGFYGYRHSFDSSGISVAYSTFPSALSSTPYARPMKSLGSAEFLGLPKPPGGSQHIKPLRFWRNERVEYIRGGGASEVARALGRSANELEKSPPWMESGSRGGNQGSRIVGFGSHSLKRPRGSELDDTDILPQAKVKRTATSQLRPFIKRYQTRMRMVDDEIEESDTSSLDSFDELDYVIPLPELSAAFTDPETGDTSDEGSESSMEWEDDAENSEEEAARRESRQLKATIVPTPPVLDSDLIDPSFRPAHNKMMELTYEVNRLEAIHKHCHLSEDRIKRLNRSVEAERYVSALHRQSIRDSRAESLMMKEGKEKAERELLCEQKVLQKTQAREQASASRVSSMKEEIAALLKSKIEAEQAIADASLKAERLSQTLDERTAIIKAELDLAQAQRAAALEAKAVEVEQRQAAEARIQGADEARVEAEKKLAAIREAHDIEREMYVGKIKALQAELDAAKELAEVDVKVEVAGPRRSLRHGP